jgi:hypothetical protein
VDLVAACHNCFRYWGGMPREMVFDQDRLDEQLDCRATEFLKRIREENPGMPETSSGCCSLCWTSMVPNRCWMLFPSV